MKGILLGGTALSAFLGTLATPAEAQFQLGLGGYMQQYLIYNHIDASGGLGSGADAFGGFDVKSNSEVWFVGSATLDNGVKFGVNLQLEGNTNSADQIDESYLFVEGAFGQFNVGSENSAGYLMTFAAPAVGVGINSVTVLTGFVPQGGAFAGSGLLRGPLGSTYVELDRANDSEKLTYFTPRFAGFQFGASYLPDPRQDSNEQVDESTVSFRNGVSLGANFTGVFEAVEVKVSGRYDWADDKSPAGSDPSLYSIGVNLGYAGVTVGGSYAHTSDMGADTGRSFDLGVAYQTDAWGVSVTYLDGEAEGTAAPGTSDYHAFEAAASYGLAPGIKVIGSVIYLDLAGDDGRQSSGLAGVTGVKLTF